MTLATFDDLDLDVLRRILDRALANGGEFAELFLEDTTADALFWDDGKLDRASAGRERGAGLRVVDGELNWFANSNDASPDGLLALAGRMAHNLARARAARSQSFSIAAADPPPAVSVWPDDVPVAEKTGRLVCADRVCRGYDPRVTQATLTLSTVRRRTVIANSTGTLAVSDTPLLTFTGAAVARERGELRSGREATSATAGWEFLSEQEVERVARTAARVACLQLEADPAPSGAMPVVLSSQAGGTMIHEACGHGLEADFYLKGLSIYSGRLGQKVAGEKISVVDDGTLPGRRGTSRVDDEGCPTRRVALIEGGVLVGLLHSRETARRLNMAATGNGRRESHHHLPIPRMRNTFIQQGEDDPEEIVASVAEGLFVAQMGGGEVDIVSGNFVFHCSEAYRIRRGKVAAPVRDATLTGAGPAVLGSIDRVGRDLGWAHGTCGKDGQHVPVSDAQPTIRIPALVVGGTGGGGERRR